MAPTLAQKFRLFGRFDTFANDLHLQRVRHAEDHFNNRIGLRIFRRARDKLSVDLEHVEINFGQNGEV